jgi:hypothetical protein
VVLRHTPAGQVSTMLTGIVLGGVALLRGFGLSSDWLVETGIFLLPLLALATWANLFWVNRQAALFQGSSRE